jgi:hypothetical protein
MRTATAPSVLSLILTGCVVTQPISVTPQSPSHIPTEAQPVEVCEYLNTYVDPESYVLQGKRTELVESLRMEFLDHCATAASDVGLKIVSDPSNAYFRLRAGASIDTSNNVEMGVMLDAYLKFQHHMFVVMLNDTDFPYRGSIGTEFTWEFRRSYSRRLFKSWADKSLSFIWNRDSEQILAMCEAREILEAEGWAAVEELRDELVIEMKRVRAERARETQRKQLELETEYENSR